MPAPLISSALQRGDCPNQGQIGGSDMSAENLLSKLERVKRTGQGRWIARCPAHDDKSPSLSIHELADGRVLLHCFAGCNVGLVCTAVGLQVSDLYPPRPAFFDDRNRLPRERRPFDATDALRLIDHEIADAALLIAVCADNPEQLTPERRTRLMQRARTVRQARAACGLRAVSC